ncbi:MAG: HD domain-containing phosphohydrolase [Pseudomonadota bacterium]
MNPSTNTAFADANPHALGMIMDSAEQCEIVASEDIYDEHDVKLWSSGQPVTRQLQQRLLERKLKRPLESCLRAQDGVSLIDILDDVDAFFATGCPLAEALRPQAVAVAHEIPQLQLHPVAQLLLTAARSSQTAAYPHAIRGMVLAGAIAHADGPADPYFLRLAMLGGLLHDIGEMYVNPQYLQASQKLTVEEYRHVVAHPRIGQSLLASQTDYPEALTRAISEHHERLDGSGYPGQKTRDAISPLGQLLGVVETTLGIAASAETPLARTSFAMRVIPGEYPLKWIGLIASAAHRADEDLGGNPHDSQDGQDADTLHALDTCLAACLALAGALGTTSRSEPVRRIAAKALHLLERLRAGWNTMGMWSAAQGVLPADQRFERRMAQRELRWRMSYVQRECLWPVRGLEAADAAELQPLWDALSAN